MNFVCVVVVLFCVVVGLLLLIVYVLEVCL